MKIAIPSYQRANRCPTWEFLKTGLLFVHEFEADQYSNYYGKENVRVIPDELKGKGMGKIRNFILDNIDDDEIVMLDDDIKYFGYYEKCELSKFLTLELLEFFTKAFQMTREMGTVLWGMNLQSDKKFYREYSPFSLSSVILGPCRE